MPNGPSGTEVSIWYARAGSAAIAVDIRDPALQTVVRRVLSGLAHAGPCGALATVAAVAEPGGWRVEAPRTGVRRCTSLDEAVAVIEWLVVEELLARTTQVPLHAAGTRVDGSAVLAFGPPGAGKSAVAHAWSGMGLPVYGDDVVLLDGAREATAFRRLGKLARPLARQLAATIVEAGDGADAGDLWTDPAAGGGWAATAEIAVCAHVRWVPGAPPRLEDVPRATLLARVIGETFRPLPVAFDALAGMVARARTVVLEFGDARAAAPLLAACRA